MNDRKENLDALHALRERLTLLTYIYGYRRGNFVLSSGLNSTYYIDAKQVLMRAEGLHAMAMYILLSLREQHIDAEAIGGLTLGADPIAAAVCALCKTAPHFRPLDCFIVRKEAKKHGTSSRIEGPFYKGLKVVIVDDVLTTGASILSAAAAVKEQEAKVGAVYVLVDRREGGREALLKAGCRMEAVLSRTELEQLQSKMTALYPELFEALQAGEPQWGKIPWQEIETRHAPLRGPFQDVGAQLARAAELGLDEEVQRKAAQLLLAAIKAAGLQLEGEAEAMKIIRRVKIDLALS